MSDYSSNYSNVIANFSDEISTDDCNDNCESINIKEKSGDELLIELYRERPFLYDKSNASFKDSSMKQNAWIEISKIMIQVNSNDMYTPLYCQKRCTSLRDQYNREKRKIEIDSKSGSAAAKTTRFPFFSQLTFLDCVIKRRRSHTNCTKSEPNKIDEDGSTFESQSDMNESSNEENKSFKQKYIHTAKNLNKENVAPKIKKQKVNETKELEQTLVQMSHRISNYMEKKVSTPDDAFIEFIRAQLNNIPEKETNIRRKMIMDVLIVPLPEK